MQQELLVIDRKNTQMEASAGRLTLRIPDQRPVSLPLAPLERILVATPVQMSSQLLNHLSTHQVAIIFLPGNHRHTACWITPHSHGDHQRRLQQYQLASQPEQQLRLARLIVRHKLIGQKRNIQTWQQQFPASKSALQRSKDTLSLSLGKLNQASSQDSLMGLEGTAAHAYFQGISQMLAPSYGFTGRNRRPPKDPINALLSLSYTLGQHEAEAALTAHGLDVGIGFLHSTSYGRPSLGCDLLELARPAIDQWVLQLFISRTLTPEHFQYQGEACRLGKAGRQHYFIAWARFRHSIKKRFHRLVRKAIKELRHA